MIPLMLMRCLKNCDRRVMREGLYSKDYKAGAGTFEGD